MKLVLLITGGRGGSDFFHGLLDNHDQILQFPGILRVNKNFYDIFSGDAEDIAKKFIDNFSIFFDSRKNLVERHNKLGKDRNKFYTVNKKKFIYYFKKKYKKTDTKKTVLINLHKSYYLSRGKNVKNAKILFLHTHTVEFTKNFSSFFKTREFDIIHTMRRPINSLHSPIKNWLNYRNGGVFFPKNLYFQLDLTFKGLKNLNNLTTKKVYVVLLENLKKNKSKVMKEFSKIYKINFKTSLLNCTFFGMQWWGDQISNRWIGKKVKADDQNIDRFFFEADLKYIHSITQNIENHFFSTNKKVKNYLSILPLKSEILVWKNTLKHKKFLHILSIPFYYFKRILFLNSYLIKYDKFPKTIGGKNTF